MLYQPTAEQVKEFTRKARKVERMLQKKGGTLMDPILAISKVDEIIFSVTVAELVPPDGGRIHIVRVPVRLDREWQEAINAAGPDTPDNYNVRKVGDQYPPRGNRVVEAEIVLMNFGPNGGNWDKAIAWADQYRLKRTNPRYAFAIGEHKPELHRELEMDYMYAVATEECTFGGDRDACFVWWGRSERGCGLSRVGDYGGPSGWFAFLRE